jgi:hypothetical protein
MRALLAGAGRGPQYQREVDQRRALFGTKGFIAGLAAFRSLKNPAAHCAQLASHCDEIPFPQDCKGLIRRVQAFGRVSSGAGAQQETGTRAWRLLPDPSCLGLWLFPCHRARPARSG